MDTFQMVGKSSPVSLLMVALFQLLPHGCQSAFLHESCSRSSDCKAELSHCDERFSTCVCQPYTVEHNKTTCLPGTLLGFECDTDAQCAIKVPRSGCVNGVCSCEQGFVAYRRHTCLPPAKISELCFQDSQCSLADRSSYCKFVVPRVFGRCHCQPGRELDASGKHCVANGITIGQPCHSDSECSMANAYCQRKLDGNSVCTCEIAFSPSADRRRCLPTYRGLLSATSLGYPCHANLQCQLADPNAICKDGICDCASRGNSSSLCNAKNTGCHRSTFQCHGDGTCISWYFVCDGKNDCPDGSDEICDVSENCPKQAFQCQPRKSPLTRNAIKCISKSKLCDGVEDCESGEDEKGCQGKETCPPGTFQCSTTKECLPEHHFCNSVADCKDLSDENEHECRLEFQPTEFCPFRCANGLCRSSAIVCSGVNGCGDYSDEQDCSVCRCPRMA